MKIEDLKKAHKHSSNHRSEIINSNLVGCFYCLKIFPSSEIDDWIDQDKNNIGQCATCPYCSIDSLIGDKSNYPINKYFLSRMNSYWFTYRSNSEKKVIKSFESSIKRGTGEAILILKDNPDLNVINLIIDASLNNFSYDPQIEDGKENYLYELIQLSNEKDKIEEILLKELSEYKEETWGLYQLFELAKLMSKNGNKLSKESIYERYSKNLDPEYEFVNTFVMIDLDAFEGFKFITELKGKYFSQNKDYWDDDYIFYYAKDIFQEINFEQQIELESSKNKYIKIFLDEIKKYRDKDNDTHKKKKYSYKSIIECIEKDKKIYSFMVKKLSNREILKLANNLKKEKDNKKLLKYLDIFHYIKYPLEVNILIDLLKSNKKKIIKHTLDTLKFFKENSIRNIFVEKINSNNFNDEYIDLLIGNYEEGDYKVITKRLKKIRNIDRFHRLGLSVLDIYEKNKTKECFEPLKILYDKGICSFCRKNVIEILLENDVLPEYIRAEAIFDSNVDIRELKKI